MGVGKCWCGKPRALEPELVKEFDAKHVRAALDPLADRPPEPKPTTTPREAIRQKVKLQTDPCPTTVQNMRKFAAAKAKARAARERRQFGKRMLAAKFQDLVACAKSEGALLRASVIAEGNCMKEKVEAAVQQDMERAEAVDKRCRDSQQRAKAELRRGRALKWRSRMR